VNLPSQCSCTSSTSYCVKARLDAVKPMAARETKARRAATARRPRAKETECGNANDEGFFPRFAGLPRDAVGVFYLR
jgi:hypothetical protein